ncbi:MAG: protein kinase domain-containing protein [Planctomycetota bacterium]|jgi:CheY-like chemotaxis protein
MTENTGESAGKTVLVVEDEEPIRNLLCDLLKGEGYGVITAVNGVEGVQHTFAEAPDVVLTDILMPGMDGLAYIRRVRSQLSPSSLPIVVVSALATEEKIVEAFEAGATDYLIKPFRTFELLARIRVALKQRLYPQHVDASDELRTPPPRTVISTGSILDMGKYAILGEIGEGGMGAVYHARHTAFGTEAAVKVLDPERCDDRRSIMRFLREVRIAAQMDHPNIVKIFDLGLTQRVYYYAMEKLPSRSLAERVWEEGALTEREVLDIGLQLASALAYMHDLRFIHRDVKPENVLFSEEGRAKLIDFGLARALDDGRLTREGSFVGTPGYVAPENIAKYQNPVPAADIYALGSTLYTAAAGKGPFHDKEDPTVKLQAQLLESPPAPHLCRSNLSNACSAAIMKMMSKDPAERYASMAEVQAELERVSGAQAGISANPA